MALESEPAAAVTRDDAAHVRDGLSATEMLKEEGDKHYKAAAFEEAIECYTKVLRKRSRAIRPLP